jgi:hypothetical protein
MTLSSNDRYSKSSRDRPASGCNCEISGVRKSETCCISGTYGESAKTVVGALSPDGVVDDCVEGDEDLRPVRESHLSWHQYTSQARNIGCISHCHLEYNVTR